MLSRKGIYWPYKGGSYCSIKFYHPHTVIVVIVSCLQDIGVLYRCCLGRVSIGLINGEGLPYH